VVVRSIAGLLTATSLAYLVLVRADMVRTAAFLREAEKRLSPADVVYQVDGAGFTGFWLSAQVVNGDGLVNSFQYRDLQRDDRLAGYLQTIGARFVLTNEPALGERVIDHHGLVVSRDDLTLHIDTGETRHLHARFRLFELRD
jgi:hypothetical protein